jgi:hypothetical protein
LCYKVDALYGVRAGAQVTPLEATLQQVKDVIAANRRTEIFLLIGIGALFSVGIVSALKILIDGQYVWSIPVLGASLFLKWPLERVELMRKRNIALAAAPIFIAQLPPAQAAKEVQKILEQLFKDKS